MESVVATTHAAVAAITRKNQRERPGVVTACLAMPSASEIRLRSACVRHGPTLGSSAATGD